MRKLSKIIWVTPSDVSKEEIEEAIKCNIDGIQLRCKTLSEEQLLPLANFAKKNYIPGRQAAKHQLISRDCKASSCQ